MIPNPADIPPPPAAPEDNSSATQELLRQSVEAKNNAMALLESVQSVVGIAESAVREQMQKNPYLTMGAAAGAGYVLAGGLASSVSRQLVKAGTKAASAFVLGVILKKVKDTAEEVAHEVKIDKEAAEAGMPTPAPAE